jgi:hypothetical protein
VPTFKHTPFISGRFASAGDRSLRTFCDILPCRSTWINVHLCARDAGMGRMLKGVMAFWRAVEERAGRERVWGRLAKMDGRTRHRRNWTGMLDTVLSSREDHFGNARDCDWKMFGNPLGLLLGDGLCTLPYVGLRAATQLPAQTSTFQVVTILEFYSKHICLCLEWS